MKVISFIKKYLLKHKFEVMWFVFLNLVLWSLSMLTPYVTGNYIDNLVASLSDNYATNHLNNAVAYHVGDYVSNSTTYLVGSYATGITPNINESLIWQTVVVLAIIWTLQLILSYVRNIINTRVNSLISFSVRYDLVEHLKCLPIRYFADKDSAYINQRVSTDSSNISGFVLGNVVGLLTTLLTFAFALVIMFFLNYSIALMICLLFPVYILIYFKFRQPLYELSYKLAEESNEFHGRANKQLTNIRIIKQNAWGERTGEELKTGFVSLFQTIMKNARLNYIFNNADVLVRYLANLIIFVYSGFQIMGGYMSIGQFTMINSYSLMVISSLSVFLGFGKNYRDALVAYDRIMEIHNTEQEKSGAACIDAIENITIKNLSFNYNDRCIIKDFSTEMKNGNIYAIVGENGSGKSTFLNILSGMIQDYSGEIRFNSISLRDINIYHLREKCLTVVEQEPTLYFETLRENISLENDKEQLMDYWINRLDLSDLISSLPGGLDYNISEKTANLSGGEKQRLAEVRAFVKDADLLIMDEPNSALDKSSLQLLCEILQEIKHNKIIVIVTHDQSLVGISDNVIDFKSGGACS